MSTIEEQAREAALSECAVDESVGWNFRLGFRAAAAPREELIAELVGVCNRALEALYNVPLVGDTYDQQHSDTHQIAALDLAGVIAKVINR